MSSGRGGAPGPEVRSPLAQPEPSEGGAQPPLAARLLAWYGRHARDLPWRGRRDPWATWVSEVMLQQTRVEVVADAFRRFLAEFPTPADFAAADDDRLQRAWQGLGYYRRARLLREGARQVVAEHAGEVPADPAALQALAGIGEYTRGAIASIAFGRPEPALDGNVERVFARHAGIRDDVKRGPTRRRLRALVVAALDPERPGDFNQALMDLGATVCTPRNPACPRCPIAADCEARRLGIQRELPVLPARRAQVEVRARVVLVADRRGRLLGARIPDGQVNQGQIELPGPGILVDHPADGPALAAALAERFGLRVEVGPLLATVRHGITHHRITLHAHEARLLGRAPAGVDFCDPDAADLPWSTPSRKVLRRIRGG
jgi:A/G-specific adenine glycosylase